MIGKEPATPLRDTLGRAITDLRISVTDRCDLRCAYCMPQDHYQWQPKSNLLRFEEITRIARLFTSLGVQKIRITGGEPLIRNHLVDLIRQLRLLNGVVEVSLTTNATRLADQAQGLVDAGLKRVNISLDTLDAKRFHRLTKRNAFEQVMRGIDAAIASGLSPVKINCVIQRGFNDDEILPMSQFARERGCPLRFIEFMDVGNENGWRLDAVVQQQEILAVLHQHYALEPLGRSQKQDPATLFRYSDRPLTVGVIPSISSPFCEQCSRARLTADGRLVTCLFATDGLDLRTPIRQGLSDGSLLELIGSAWQGRRDRYSAERKSHTSGNSPKRKLEMIQLGG